VPDLLFQRLDALLRGAGGCFWERYGLRYAVTVTLPVTGLTFCVGKRHGASGFV
jgi:hypothetical protein